jgi:trk system potassium uptake protein TrkH
MILLGCFALCASGAGGTGGDIKMMRMLQLLCGLDVITAFTAVIACVNHIGPGLGDVGPAVNYGGPSGFQT